MTSKDLQMTPNDLKQPQIAVLKCKMDTHQHPLKSWGIVHVRLFDT